MENCRPVGELLNAVGEIRRTKCEENRQPILMHTRSDFRNIERNYPELLTQPWDEGRSGENLATLREISNSEDNVSPMNALLGFVNAVVSFKSVAPEAATAQHTFEIHK